MANKFLIKRGDGAPAQGAIDQYELVYDYTGNQLYTKVGSTITPIGSGTSTSGSNNQVLTDDGSGGINSEGSLLFSGSTLEINNSGDWSFIKNNTNSGGLRFGTKDSGGTYANQIEISNTGNYVKLNENTTVTGKVEASGKLKSTMNGGFTIGNVAGEDRIQNSSNSFSFLTDGNAYANVNFATVSNGTWNGTAIASAYLDADTAHLSTNQTFSGTKTFSSVVKLQSELDFTGNSDKYIDVETLENSDSFRIRNHNPLGNVFHDALKLVGNGGAHLYYNNSKKLETTNTGATVSGNITVSGTVDGRDVASDGSKLDGIASGATANTGTVTSANGANDRIATFSSSTALNGESTLTWNGSDYLTIQSADGSEGGIRLQKSTTDGTHIKYHISHRDDNQSLIIYSYDGTTFRNWITLDEPNGLLKLGSNSSNLCDIDTSGNFRFANQVEFQDTNAVINRVSNDLEIRTYGGYDINLMSAGNVGIGTTSPANELHVAGSMKADTSLLIGSNSNFLTSQLKVGDGTRDIRLNANHSSNAVVGTVGSHDFNIMTNNTFRMTVDNAGKIGIGTTNPSELLHINSSSGDARIMMNAPDGSDTEIKFFNNGSSVWTLGHDDGSGSFRLGTANVDTNVAINVDSSRRVGIGTTSPGALFTVYKDGTQASSVSTTYQIQTVSNSNGGIAIQAGDSSIAYLVFGDNGDYDAGRIAYTNSSNQMGFYTNNSERVTIDSAGVVDILNKMTLPASHSADKITMYDGGNEKIGTEANTLLFTADNLKVKDTSGNANLTWNSHTLTVSGNNANGINMAQDGSDTNNSERIFFTGSSTSCIFQQGADLSFRTGATAGSSSGTERVSINTVGMQIHSGSLGVGMAPNGTDNNLSVAGHIIQGNSTGGVAITSNDGGGNANICFNHRSQVPEQNGNSARIHVNTDASTDAHIEFEVATGVTNGSSVTTADACQMRAASLDIPQYLRHLGDTDTRMEFDTDTISFDTGGTEALRITSSQNVLIGGTSASGHGFNLEVLNDHAFVKGPDGWNGAGDKAIVALGSAVSNESFGCGYVYGTGLVLSTYKSSGGGHFGSSTQNSLIIADTTGQANFINDVVAFASSDIRLKENVKTLDNALDKINKINGVEFDWIDGKDEQGNSVHSNEGHDVGVIAQEIEEVLPEVVTTRDNGYKAVKYEKIVPLLIEAIKEQQEQINKLEEKLNG